MDTCEIRHWVRAATGESEPQVCGRPAMVEIECSGRTVYACAEHQRAGISMAASR